MSAQLTAVLRYVPSRAWFWASWLVVLSSAISFGQTKAEQALDSFPKNTWYDAQSRQFIPPNVEPAEDEALRHRGRRSHNSQAASNSTNSFNSSWNWIPSWLDFSWLGQWSRVLVLTTMGVAVAVMLGILIYYVGPAYLPYRFEGQQPHTAISIDPTRVVDLPFEVASSEGHPLAEAERLMRAGNFDAAIVFLYGYLLLVLDQSRKIHLQKGKTNRMYLRELRTEQQLREIIQQAMLVFEACYFGKHSVSPQQFMAAWQRVGEFHQLLQTPLAAEREVPISTEATT